ncbi:tRNA (adenosine(37)-N6)-dimethylallyltransferase MiaA [Aureimonas leprariae]|uniref:tRNA dimethylallyltransferase n=2 Tax=Plantimonas leprariae TaxID=2615207 RepID=A0A7V7TY90_9HYPH|nr:tRNA (adenosine(37)-N6)-dimethylallyltransferase MiaA [Aureimonas leprariae]
MVRERSDTTAVLIAGPTASGKSALALRLAEELGGAVVNADSMQVYRCIPILTAQPSTAERKRLPHCLYGHIDPMQDYSVGAWMREIERVLTELRKKGRVPVIVGGTGLYFRALLGGLDAMPSIPSNIRNRLRKRVGLEGSDALHTELAIRDPEAAASIRPSDPQRVVRALELIETTGQTLASIQQRRGAPLVDVVTTTKIVLTPQRSDLRERIALRFAAMLQDGALEEAARFRSLAVPAERTAAKAIGLAELADHIEGRATLDVAVERAVARSRQYAKRQETWFRHQLGDDWERLPV